MKLHNLSVIFIVIAIPLILITSYYISLQIDTINMQTAYNTKLLDSTKEAIDAFEINTVEWNANYSETADSKRRDIMASINTFTTSFANNIGVGGTSKEYILSYVPAIAYTLYDGYYIYSPANARVALTDDNGVGITMTEKLTKDKIDDTTNVIAGYTYKSEDEGKLLYVPAEGKPISGTYYIEDNNGSYTINGKKYSKKDFTLNPEDAATEYKHILKPFAAYSEKIGDMVINYTLDNYVTIYGEVTEKVPGTDEETTNYVYKSGYLSVIDSGDKGIDKFTDDKNSNTIENIKYKGVSIKPEILSEQIAYKQNEDLDFTVGTYNYVYESEGNTKVYFDNGTAFIVDSSSIRTDLNEKITRYKKITVPQWKSSVWTYTEVYQNLYDGKWYTKNATTGEYEDMSDTPSYGGIIDNKIYDYSAINYCVESYIITKWVNTNLKDATPDKEKDEDGNLTSTCICSYSHGNPFNISENNDPEKEDSDFSIHKRGIIKKVVELNLNQAITSYSRNSAGEYQLPKLTETDWDQILSNVSIIAFVQNIPIGMKYYNNYAIATSTVNKEYVDPDEIYLNARGDNYYHMPYCDQFSNTGNIIGYRSIDYVQKSYTQKQADGTKETKYYYKHGGDGTQAINVDQACYYCLVQKSLYSEDRTTEKSDAYYTALAREKYVARMSKLPAQVEASYWIHVTPIYKEGEEETTAHTAQYTINGKILTGEDSEKISKTETNYNIAPAFGTAATVPTEGEKSPTDNLGSFDNERATIDSKEFEGEIPDYYSVYESNSSANVTISKYDAEVIQFNVNPYGDANWTAGYSMDTTEQKTEFSSDQDGYINIKLKYKKNYETSAGTDGITAYANIDEKNKLTIVTNLGDVTGLVRLKFTNKKSSGESKIYYSSDIFDVEDQNSKIYCQIANDEKCWYEQDWKVQVLNVNNETIKETNKMEYYTIRNAKGLQGFAEATNEGAKTNLDDAKKTKPRYFYLISDIESVGEMTPICLSDGEEKSWFDGVFSGAYNEGLESAATPHYIKNITIKTDSNANHAFGLFGYIGGPGEVNNLVIDTIKIEGVTQNTYVGGLAGKADERQPDKGKDEIGKSIKNITVQGNSTIKGTTYVGGIIGENKKELNNSRINGTSISSLGTKNDTNNDTYIYVGGIAAKSTANISGCTVENSSTIGGGAVNVKSPLLKKDKYYVGGIVGYTTGTVTSITVSENTKVVGGKINHTDSTKLDTYFETYTGGIIGYKNSLQPVDNSFSVGCTVSGHDNVGGIIGFNAGGDINDVQFSGTISSGTGENIGGIVGCNTGGTISNCINSINISVTGKSVGGIAGCNYNKNITNCYNKASVTGNQNVGGIVGICYGGTIDYCGNENTITGNNNTNYLGFYYTASNDCTGTGGITGKLYRAKVLHSYNSGKINCNYNGGGIAGLNYEGTVEYSYNSETISSNGGRNRIGGICGAGNTVYINACYNIGTINGNNDIDVLSNGMGGIIGSCVDNAYFIYIGKTELFPDSKYLGEIDVPVLRTGQTVNVIIYCYNTGSLNGSTGSSALNHACGIIGCILWAPNTDNITLESNYYLDNRENGAKGSWSNIVSTGVTKLSVNNMKKQLYKWADSSLKVDSDYVYNTVAPMKTTDFGYEGYGVLWWQLKDYVRLTTNMFLCNKQTSEDGTVTYDYTNFKNTGYNQTITLINSENEETKIAFKDTKFDLCRITDSFNGKPVNNTTGCYRWIMMIPKGSYGVKGTTDFSDKSQFFNNSSMLYEGQRYDVDISNNTTLYIAPILEVVTDRFNIKDIEVEWKREYTTINRYGVYTKPDFIPRTIKVNAYYDKKPNSSSYSINGKTASIYLDKLETLSTTNNTTAYLDDYIYYTMGFFKMNGPYTKSGDTEEVRADSAECNVYIPVENLVDRLGADSAKNYILHTAKINMKYRIRMWCEKGDFGSWWTNPAKLKNSTLEYNITVQRKEKGSSDWVDIKSINVPTQYKKQTSESGNIGDDGYYVFEYEIDKEDFSGSLAGVNYDDELRIVVRLDFVSKEGNCTFYIDSADLDITYGPNVTE